jgi:hypothetical protein
MTPTLPAGIDEITPEWMTAALTDGGTIDGALVTDLDATRMGEGVGTASALYRVGLSYDPPGSGPDQVVVKLPAFDETAHFTSTVLRMYAREVHFFTEVAPTCPIRVPQCHFGAVDAEGARFAVVMEDMGDQRIVDQIEGIGPDDAGRAIDELAEQHGVWWGRGEDLAEMASVVPLDDPMYPAILPTVFTEGWEKVTAELEVAPAIAEVAPRFPDAIEGLMARLSEPPVTFIHGDYRADNMFFDRDDGSMVLLDFQLGGRGVGPYDLAYFATQSATSVVRRAHEQEWFGRYCDGLEQAGGADVDRDRLWDDYRHAALFCLVYPIVAARGMDLDNPRERDLVDAMNDRFGTAVTDLDLAELI